MVLVRAWADSLSLFLPHNWYRFTLVTLNAALMVYKQIFFARALGKAAFLLALDFVGAHYYPVWISCIVHAFIIADITLCVLLATRPTVEQKTVLNEEKLYWQKGFLLLVFYAYLLLMPLQATYGGLPFIGCFFVLFVLDSRDRNRYKESLHRAVQMVVYNAPLLSILCSATVWVIRMLGGYYACDFWGVAMWNSSIILAYIVLSPIILSFVVNIYSKKLYDQFSLYYDEA